jgi:hypothetical protein
VRWYSKIRELTMTFQTDAFALGSHPSVLDFPSWISPSIPLKDFERSVGYERLGENVLKRWRNICPVFFQARSVGDVSAQ